MGGFAQRQGRCTRRLGGLAVGAVVVALALAVAACSSNSSGGSSGTPVKGGTAVMAEFPSSPPNYVFPFMNSTYASNSNIFDLQWLMYRPLYWFGTGAQPTLNTSLSLAYPATFSGPKVTVKLKDYMWSNGTPVTASDVMFWLNMLLAVPQDWGLGTGFPQDVHDITVVSSTELTMVMNKAYSPTWFQYNELSQITPIPAAWDRTASGPSHCDTTVSDCAAVYNYLNKQAQDMAGYATSPIWQIVDGPWHLSAFSSDGHMTFVPNNKYSGPVKPKLAAFEEVPFTTDAAEYDVLQSPSSSTKIDYGYLPPEDAPDKPAGADDRRQPAARLHPVAAVRVRDRLLLGQRASQYRQRPDPEAAVLPAGDGVPDQPESGDRRPAARLRRAHGRPGRQHPGDPVPVGGRQGPDRLRRRPVPV